MSNECQVFEMKAPSNPHVAIRVVPFIRKQLLSSGDTTAAFNRSTQMITVVSSLAGVLTFTTKAGVDPDGTTDSFPIAADAPLDFEVRAGTKVRFT